MGNRVHTHIYTHILQDHHIRHSFIHRDGRLLFASLCFAESKRVGGGCCNFLSCLRMRGSDEEKRKGTGKEALGREIVHGVAVSEQLIRNGRT